MFPQCFVLPQFIPQLAGETYLKSVLRREEGEDPQPCFFWQFLTRCSLHHLKTINSAKQKPFWLGNASPFGPKICTARYVVIQDKFWHQMAWPCAPSEIVLRWVLYVRTKCWGLESSKVVGQSEGMPLQGFGWGGRERLAPNTRWPLSCRCCRISGVSSWKRFVGESTVHMLNSGNLFPFLHADGTDQKALRKIPYFCRDEHLVIVAIWMVQLPQG